MPHCSMRLASRRSLSCTLGNSRCIANALRCSDGTDKGSKLLSKLISRHVFQIGELARGANLFASTTSPTSLALPMEAETAAAG